jgi:hypothetical protein
VFGKPTAEMLEASSKSSTSVGLSRYDVPAFISKPLAHAMILTGFQLLTKRNSTGRWSTVTCQVAVNFYKRYITAVVSCDKIRLLIVPNYVDMSILKFPFSDSDTCVSY